MTTAASDLACDLERDLADILEEDGIERDAVSYNMAATQQMILIFKGKNAWGAKGEGV